MNTIIAAGLFFVSIFAAGLTQTAPLYGSRSLETITFMPRERELQYPPLQGINNLTAETIQMEYTRVLECMQQVDSLSAEMGKRLNESVPPPHHHCFIWERDLDHLHLLNHNTTQGLRCDQHMLSPFSSALDRAAIFEGLHFQNQETRVILKVKSMMENILSVLSNFTGVVVNETTAMGTEDRVACGAPQGSEEEQDGDTEEERSGTRTREESTGQESSITGTAEESTGYLPSRPSSPNSRESISSTQVHRQTLSEDTVRCGNIENADDQFIYITELRYALYYLKLDLMQLSYCL